MRLIAEGAKELVGGGTDAGESDAGDGDGASDDGEKTDEEVEEVFGLEGIGDGDGGDVVANEDSWVSIGPSAGFMFADGILIEGAVASIGVVVDGSNHVQKVHKRAVSYGTLHSGVGKSVCVISIMELSLQCTALWQHSLVELKVVDGVAEAEDKQPLCHEVVHKRLVLMKREVDVPWDAVDIHNSLHSTAFPILHLSATFLSQLQDRPRLPRSQARSSPPRTASRKLCH